MSAWLAVTVASGVTVAAYVLAVRLQTLAKGALWLHPQITSSLALGLGLAGMGIAYGDYYAAVWPVHGLLGPATVALAVPMAGQWGRLKRLWLPVSVGLLAGALSAAASALLLTRVCGGDRLLELSLGPKSTTTPIAMALSQRLGGDPSMTAVVVVMTGITGAVLGPWLLDVMGVRDPVVRGLSMGVASHGTGTAAAAQESEETGAWSGLAMGLSGLMTAAFLPSLERFLL